MQVSYSEQYKNCLQSALNGVQQTNARTGMLVYTANKPLFLTIDLTNNKVPLSGNRTIYPNVALAEVAWQSQGTKDPQLIMKYAPKLWGKFIEGNEIKASYGYRWCKEFDRNQIDMALKALKTDATTRQVYVSTWNPSCDGLGAENQPKNIPCIVGFTLTIVDNKLNMAVNMRSSDLYVGLPYDILVYGFMLKAFATELNIDLGYLTFQLANAHFYENVYEHVKTDLENAENWLSNIQEIEMPDIAYSDIELNPETYIAYYKSQGLKINNFNVTRPEVIA